MTRATRSSKRKPGKSSQEIIPEDFKQVSPSILSQSTAKQTLLQNTCSTAMKENISPKESTRRPLKSMSVSRKEVCSPVRKSVRHQKSSPSVRDVVLKNISERNVLCDKTNSMKTRGKAINKRNIEIIQTIENKNTLYKIISVPDPNLSNSVQENSPDKKNICKGTHIPIYKNKGLLEIGSESKTSSENKNDGVYEFEVDENEEPVQKKKRKKRVNPRKPKIGPKALTINNIKYSSTESLVSLPEKPIARKKKPTKGSKDNLKHCSSVVTLNDDEDTCYSVKSFMSHPPSQVSRENRNIKSKHQLSILQETQSEHCTSPVNMDFINEHPPDNNSDSHTPFNISANPKNNNDPYTSVLSNFSPNPRCYVSKTSNKTNSNLSHHSEACQKSANDTLSLQLSSYSANVSVTSTTHNFLSSTPCKRTSLVVRNNSVFDDSCDLPHGMRPSTGFIKDVSASVSASVDHCFGFDEPEELEEPLVSPIKGNIDLVPRKPVKLLSWKTKPNQVNVPKPSTQEVIEMLKASIPKAATKQTSDVFDISTQQCSSPTLTDEHSEVAVSFRKPPRRSYERQRRVRHYSDHEEEDYESEKENNAVEEEKENVPKVVKNCYKKKGNTTRTTKPKVTKSKQRAAKEEEELERLAAQMNAQFQQIEKVNLVVE